MLSIRMNDTEYAAMQDRINQSGLSKQAYVIRSVTGAPITTSGEIDTLKEINRSITDIDRQLRGMGTNINQMAHVANGHGYIPEERDLEKLAEQIKCYREESMEIWQSLRSSINQQKAMGL